MPGRALTYSTSSAELEMNETSHFNYYPTSASPLKFTSISYSTTHTYPSPEMNVTPRLVRTCRVCHLYRAIRPAGISRAIHISRTCTPNFISDNKIIPRPSAQSVQTRSYVQKDQRETKSYATVKEAMEEIEEA